MLMHKNKKAIVVIGAGSASFGLSTLGAILRKPELKGSDLRLIDINEDGLNTITKLAEKANKEWSAGFTIKSSTSRDELLKGANFIIINSSGDELVSFNNFTLSQLISAFIMVLSLIFLTIFSRKKDVLRKK